MNEKLAASLKKKWVGLVAEGQNMTFRKGQVLFYEGHAPYGVFLLKSGKAHFTQGDHPCRAEHYWDSPKGQVIGLDHFFEGTPFCCTCTATLDCEAIFISKTQLMPFAN